MYASRQRRGMRASSHCACNGSTDEDRSDSEGEEGEDNVKRRSQRSHIPLCLDSSREKLTPSCSSLGYVQERPPTTLRNFPPRSSRQPQDCFIASLPSPHIAAGANRARTQRGPQSEALWAYDKNVYIFLSAIANIMPSLLLLRWAMSACESRQVVRVLAFKGADI